MFGLRVTPTLFLSTPSARRATSCANRKRPTSADFYPRPPRGGRPELLPGVRPPVEISIHALREEGDQWGCHNKNSRWRFLSTPSARRATDHVLARVNAQCISIHALREEGDVVPDGRGQVIDDFYPRPPRGGRHGSIRDAVVDSLFLSTPSARRATSHCMWIRACFLRFLSTPSARRATAGKLTAVFPAIHFYPRPPRGGRPHRQVCLDGRHADFYPRPPRGGRPKRWSTTGGSSFISIHALREEGDEFGVSKQWLLDDFYPRPPRGGRPDLPVDCHGSRDISIHALREEGDPLSGVASKVC